MDVTDTGSWIVVEIAVVALIAVVAAVVIYRARRTSRLRERFGPEYGRAVEQFGGAGKAESELKAREKRVALLRIVPLSAADAVRFSNQWKEVQGRFVDDPQRAAVLADRLVHELMVQRGYPMGDFERSAADISVDHPVVVENYRAARVILMRHERDTEQLRRALVHYRALFDELLEVDPDKRAAAPPASALMS
jgi:hypothetical protein